TCRRCVPVINGVHDSVGASETVRMPFSGATRSGAAVRMTSGSPTRQPPDAQVWSAWGALRARGAAASPIRLTKTQQAARKDRLPICMLVLLWKYDMGTHLSKPR